MSGVAGNTKVILTAQDVSYSQVFENARRKAAELGSEVGSASARMRREMKEAQGAVMVFGEEMGVHLPRHVQRFLVQLPGVASLVSKAFSGVAIFAMGAAVVELGEKVVKFFEEMESRALKTQNAWRGFMDPLGESNDELQVTADKLDQAIAKLEHKPQNGIKLAIDEAIESADKLTAKIAESATRIHDLVEQTKPGWFAQFAGTAGANDVNERAQGLNRQMNAIDAEQQLRVAQLRSSGASQEQVQAAVKGFADQIRAVFQQESTWVVPRLQQAQADKAWSQGSGGPFNTHGGPDVSQRLDILNSYASYVLRQMNQMNLTGQVQSKQGVLDKDQAMQDAKRAAQERLQLLQQALEAEEVIHGKSAQLEFGYWRSKLSAFAQGSREYNEVAQRMIAASHDYFDKPSSGAIEQDRLRQRQLVMDDAIGGRIGFRPSSEGYEAFTQAGDRSEQERLVAQGQLQEAMDRVAQQSGQMGGSEFAARQRQRIQAQYLAQRLALDAQIRQMEDQAEAEQQLTGGPDYDLNARLVGLRSQRNTITARYQASDAEASYAERIATAMGHLEEETSKLANQFTDLGGYLASGLKESLNGFNEQVVRALSGQRTSFGDFGAGIFRTVSKDALQSGEGQLMKAFGFGSQAPKGTASDPMHVVVQNAFPSGGGSASTLSNVFSNGGLGSSAGNMTEGVFSGIGSMLLKNLPGFASGGDIDSGVLSMVGEQGPELFMPRTAGTIIPNSQINIGGSGGGDTHTYHIDARGATDPAAVEASVHRAMASIAPQMAANTIAAGMDARARSAPTRSRF